MTRSDASFPSENFKIAAHLYVPDTYQAHQKLPAVVVVNPFGGVKEQTAVSKPTFDRRYQGASDGTPRQQEDPFGAAEDIKSAVTFLSLEEQVDPKRIGILGICAGGGYVLFAAPMDHRIKAVATISGVDLGAFIRTIPKPTLDAERDHGPDPELMAEGANYYLTPRGGHPSSINRTTVWSYDRMAIYDSFAQLDQISPRPVLLIAGSKADTLLYSQKAFELAKEPKELHIIDGSTHIDLYDRHAPQAYPKLTEFFKQKL
ncbi:hypothetical protein BGX24_002591 [Mortierella sp. AD032]|nr:hypothetical protein BGX24_002591 [Mortierella sp. AD032]